MVMRIGRAKLYTGDGGFVAEIQMPPFSPPADIVLWGQRAFVFVEPILGVDPYLRYREGMMWSHVDPPLSSEKATAIAREAFDRQTGGTAR